MTVWMLVPLDVWLHDIFCYFFLCGWMVGFAFGYWLNECMFAGVFICIDTDFIYLVSVFFCYCLLC
jgi:hypothetical protein